MSESNGVRISTESKIIIGVEHSEKTGWYSLHLHDALYAVSVQPDTQKVVIAEGIGRNRLRHLRLPFKNISRFEIVEMQIGHSCLTAPIDRDLLGSRELIPEKHPFTPIMVQVILKHSKKSDFLSIHQVGATPLPILVPLFKYLPAEAYANPNIALSSADDCFTLAQRTADWVRQVNAVLEEARQPAIESARVRAEELDTQTPAHERLREILRGLELYDELDVRQSTVAAGTAVQIATFLISEMGKNSLIGTPSLRSAFPLSVELGDAGHSAYSTIDDLYKVSALYQEKTGRPIEEAFQTIAEHISDLEERKVTIESSEDLKLLEVTAQAPLDVFDPTMTLNAKSRVLSRVELRHEKQLRTVFENEGVEVYFLEDLAFLSLLVEYETNDGQRHHAVFIKDGLHQALREFMLAHEMGHFFLHVKSDSAGADGQVNRFLRSSFQRTFLAKEADNFGMTVLFPPAYMADRAILEGKLSADDLIDQFVRDMPPVNPRLREAMRSYLNEHIEKHKSFKKAEPSFMGVEVESIEEEDLGVLLKLINKASTPVYWVRLSESSVITQVSDNAPQLFRLPEDDIVGKRPIELVVEDEVERMKKRAEFRKERQKAIYYFTELKNPEGDGGRQVVVYSFPILKDGEYIGAMATLRLLYDVQIESVTVAGSVEEGKTEPSERLPLSDEEVEPSVDEKNPFLRGPLYEVNLSAGAAGD